MGRTNRFSPNEASGDRNRRTNGEEEDATLEGYEGTPDRASPGTFSPEELSALRKKTGENLNVRSWHGSSSSKSSVPFKRKVDGEIRPKNPSKLSSEEKESVFGREFAKKLLSAKDKDGQPLFTPEEVRGFWEQAYKDKPTNTALKPAPEQPKSVEPEKTRKFTSLEEDIIALGFNEDQLDSLDTEEKMALSQAIARKKRYEADYKLSYLLPKLDIYIKAIRQAGIKETNPQKRKGHFERLTRALDTMTSEEARTQAFSSELPDAEPPTEASPDLEPQTPEKKRFQVGDTVRVMDAATEKISDWKIEEIKGGDGGLFAFLINPNDPNTPERIIEVRALRRFVEDAKKYEEARDEEHQPSQEKKKSFRPLQDWFLNRKGGMPSEKHIASWKRRWVDAGRIDEYRRQYGNIDISAEQIAVAKEGFDLYSRLFQTEGVPSNLKYAAISNLDIYARILTGVHDPEANDIEYFVKNNTITEGGLVRIREDVEKYENPQLDNPSASPQPLRPQAAHTPRIPTPVSLNPESQEELGPAPIEEISPEEVLKTAPKPLKETLGVSEHLKEALKTVSDMVTSRKSRLPANWPVWATAGTAAFLITAFVQIAKEPSGGNSVQATTTPVVATAPAATGTGTIEQPEAVFVGKKIEAHRMWTKAVDAFKKPRFAHFAESFPDDITTLDSKQILIKYVSSYFNGVKDQSKIDPTTMQIAGGMFGEIVVNDNTGKMYHHLSDVQRTQLSDLWIVLNDISFATSAEKLRAKTFEDAIVEIKQKVTKIENS